MSWIRGSHLWIRHGRERQGTILVVRRKLGTAVARNRLKRRLRAICRSIGSGLPVSLVVFCQPSATLANFSDLEQEFKVLLAELSAS